MGSGDVVINDFFIAMDNHFECLTTSNRMDDMKVHMKYFNPQCIVVSLRDETPEEMQRISFMKLKLVDEFLPLLKSLFEKMREALEELDMDKMDEVLAEFKSYSYPSDMQEYLNQLALSVESLDVDSCMSILEFWEKEY